MSLTHHEALLAGYGVALGAWLGVRRGLPALWPDRDPVRFERPWREFLLAIVAALAVIGIGQLDQHGWLLPEDDAGALPLLDTLDQVLVFAPMILLLVARRQPAATAWLPTQRVPARLACGLGLAGLALLAFAAARTSLSRWPEMVGSVYSPDHVRHAVHVFLEDLTIAILFVRLVAAIPHPVLVALTVSALFAAGHVPADLAQGASLVDLAPLLLDLALGVGILLVVHRSRDIWWFWCVHFAMDMTQFLPAA